MSGLLDFGVSQQYSGRSVVGLPPAELTTLTGVTGYREFVATGTDPDALVKKVTAAIGPGPQVVTGDERRKQRRAALDEH